MKKIYSLFVALMAMLAVNAQTTPLIPNLVGEFNSWDNANAPAFTEVSTGKYEITIPDLFGEVKVIVNNEWFPQFGAVTKGDSLLVGKSYVLQGKLAQEQADPQNLLIGKKGFGYKNAKLTLTATADYQLTLTFVSGEEYDRTTLPDTYQIIGGYNGWGLASALQFEDVDGKLTVTIPELGGTFKIIKNRAWTEQWATNWDTQAGLEVGVPYVMGAKGDKGEPSNLALANPFGTYKNAVLTLELKEDGNHLLTLVSGEFSLMQADWHLPGEALGWKCEADQRFTPVEGEVNTYELLVAEFGNRFKVVYGNWAVEFGRPSDEAKWEVNKEYTCALKGNDIDAIDNKHIFEDCTIRLVVDYENVVVKITISSETLPSDVEQVIVPNTVTKVIENGQIYIIRDGVRYNALGGVVQ